MRWWPVAALTAAGMFALSIGALLAAPTYMPLCDPSVTGIARVAASTVCDLIVAGTRAATIISGAILAGALVAGLHATLAERAGAAASRDTRPLVSVHPRRRG